MTPGIRIFSLLATDMTRITGPRIKLESLSKIRSHWSEYCRVIWTDTSYTGGVGDLPAILNIALFHSHLSSTELVICKENPLYSKVEFWYCIRWGLWSKYDGDGGA